MASLHHEVARLRHGTPRQWSQQQQSEQQRAQRQRIEHRDPYQRGVRRQDALTEGVASREESTRSFRPTAYLVPIDAQGVPVTEHRALVTSWFPEAAGDRGRTGLDHALRVDLLLAALTGVGASAGWEADRTASVLITRPGVLEPTEDDLAWLRAWPIACDIAGRGRGPVWAVTRSGWLDVAENTAVVLPRHRLRRTVPRPNRQPEQAAGAKPGTGRETSGRR